MARQFIKQTATCCCKFLFWPSAYSAFVRQFLFIMGHVALDLISRLFRAIGYSRVPFD